MSIAARFRSDMTTPLVGVLVAAVALFVYWLGNHNYDAGRGDFFYLAESFLHGHTWVEKALGTNDEIFRNGHVYVPFAPSRPWC